MQFSLHGCCSCASDLQTSQRDVNRVHEEWFNNSDRVRAALGILEEAAPLPPGAVQVRERLPSSCCVYRILNSHPPLDDDAEVARVL